MLVLLCVSLQAVCTSIRFVDAAHSPVRASRAYRIVPCPCCSCSLIQYICNTGMLMWLGWVASSPHSFWYNFWRAYMLMMPCACRLPVMQPCTAVTVHTNGPTARHVHPSMSVVNVNTSMILNKHRVCVCTVIGHFVCVAVCVRACDTLSQCAVQLYTRSQLVSRCTGTDAVTSTPRD